MPTLRSLLHAASDAKHLRCHHCDSQRPVPRQCPSCGSTHRVPVGWAPNSLNRRSRRCSLGVPISLVSTAIPPAAKGAGTATGGSASRRREDLDWHANAGERSPLSGCDAGGVTGCGRRLFSADFARQNVSPSFTPRSPVVPGVRVNRAKWKLQTHHPEHPLLQTLLYIRLRRLCRTGTG